MKTIFKVLKTHNVRFNKVLNGVQIKRNDINFELKSDLVKNKISITYLDTTIYLA